MSKLQEIMIRKIARELRGHLEYAELAPNQRAQADVIFHGADMERHVYAVLDGTVSGWRFYKPSEFCRQAIALVLGAQCETPEQAAREKDRADYDGMIDDLRQF
jgi:hypothetical protein